MSCTDVSKGWTRCTGIIPKERYKCYQDFHDQNMNRRGKKKQGMDELMAALTNQKDSAAATLTSSHMKQERPTPIGVSVFSGQGGLQMSIEVGIEQ